MLPIEFLCPRESGGPLIAAKKQQEKLTHQHIEHLCTVGSRRCVFFVDFRELMLDFFVATRLKMQIGSFASGIQRLSEKGCHQALVRELMPEYLVEGAGPHKVIIQKGIICVAGAGMRHRRGQDQDCSSPHHLRNMLLAHGKCVKLIRKMAKTPPKIGIAMASTTYIPDSETPEGLRDAARKSFEGRTGEDSNSLYMDPIGLGKASPMMKRYLSVEDLKIISEPMDFVGVNVYQPSNPSLNQKAYEAEHHKKTSMGWVVDGRCLYWTVRQYWERYHLPVMVTENGMAVDDAVAGDGACHDPERIAFLDEFLGNLKRAADEGIPVLGYQHWSIMDNFEWCEGYTPRFGLIHIDYRTQKRTLKDSAKHYAEIIRTNGETL